MKQGNTGKLQCRECKAFPVGATAEIRRLVRAEDIARFSELSGDHHPLHTDESYARRSGFDGVIAHGALLSAFISELVGMKLPGRQGLLLSQACRYHQPVSVGDEIRIKGEVIGNDDRFQTMQIRISVENQKAERVAGGEVMVKIRGGAT